MATKSPYLGKKEHRKENKVVKLKKFRVSGRWNDSIKYGRQIVLFLNPGTLLNSYFVHDIVKILNGEEVYDLHNKCDKNKIKKFMGC